MIIDKNIDHGKAFDFGKTSIDYARYRDIYPHQFYQKLIDKNLCVDGQKVLDIGTGTGVLPRNLYKYGASFVGVDIAENQITQAISLAKQDNMNISFMCMPAENIDFPANSFDVITACQCFTYFDHKTLAPKLSRMLKCGGRFIVLYMAWLPFEDEIAGKSEELILKYSPNWTGCKETRKQIFIPDDYTEYFSVESNEIFDLNIPFTRESWNGRIKSCRGVGASLNDNEIEKFNIEHMNLLKDIAPDKFNILHYAAITVLRKR